MLLPPSYHHLASWIYYSFVFILKIALHQFLVTDSLLTQRILLTLFLHLFHLHLFCCCRLYSTVPETYFLWLAFFPNLSLKNSSEACLAHSFHQSRSHHSTQDRICYLPGKYFAGTAILPSSSNFLFLFGLFSKDRFFAHSWTPTTVCSTTAFHHNHDIWPVWFGPRDSTTLPSARSVGALIWPLGSSGSRALPAAKGMQQFSCHLHSTR